MKMLAIYNGKNKRFRRDGDEFKREAWKWLDANQDNDLPLSSVVDVRDGRIRREIRKMKGGLDVLAIFDHGTPRGLPRMRESYKCVAGLAKTIAGVTRKITIILYACSCGRGWWKRRWKNKADIEVQVDSYSPRDGYAVALCCELSKLGVDAEIFAHLTAGHTTRNPFVVWVGRVGNMIFREAWGYPRSPHWKQWKADMRGPKRFTFWR